MNNLKHIGFIIDGNGRWAKKQNKLRTYGHKIGADKIKDVLLWCIKYNIQSVSMYAFSLENWKRSKSEVNFLMNLILKKIVNKKTISFLNENNIRFIWNGFEDQLDNKIIESLKFVQNETKKNNKLNFQLLFNYGSQQKIVETACLLKQNNLEINIENFKNTLDPYNLGYLDLIIRTSNEQRLSNFMLFEATYAEFIFSKKYWPEYDEIEFVNNLNEFFQRTRKFGGLNNAKKESFKTKN